MLLCRSACVVFVLGVLAVPASAQTSTTVGTLTLRSTFDNVSVRASYTNDSDADMTAVIQYRENGSGTWLNAYTPIIDRRTTVGAYIRQVRGSVVSLPVCKTYEVQVTFTDPDGVTGGPSLSSTIALLCEATEVVRSGGEYWWDDVGSNGDGSIGSPFNSYTNVVNNTACGAKIHIRPGTYAAITLADVCTSTTWYEWECDNNTTSIVSEGAGTAPNLTVNGNYHKVKNCNLAGSSNNNIDISTNRHHVWLENLRLVDASNTETNDQCNSSHYNDASINMGIGTHHVYVLSSHILSPHLTSTTGCTTGERFDSSGAAISFTNSSTEGTFVIKGNRFDGGWRDGIGGGEGFGQGPMDNSDVADNTFVNIKDDPIQIEGDDVNLRIWGNVVDGNQGYSALAMEPPSGDVTVGPIYVYRNIFKVSGSFGGLAIKSNRNEMTFYFHNTFDVTSAGSDGWAGGNYYVVRNSIIKGTANLVYCTGSTPAIPGVDMFDYNLYYRPDSGNIVSGWGGGGCGGASYSTPAAFDSATGNEGNGIKSNPNFLDADKNINATSPAYNEGVALANFNGPNSGWPFAGAAPDIGAREFSNAPANLIVTPSCSGIGSITVTGSSNPVKDAAAMKIVGCNFGASQGTVYLCNDATYTGSVNCISQTVTAWATGQVTATVSRSSLTAGTLYLYVLNNGGTPNATGVPVRLTMATI